MYPYKSKYDQTKELVEDFIYATKQKPIIRTNKQKKARQKSKNAKQARRK
jgi:hypothetical protein